MRYASVQDVLAEQLADLWSAERQLVATLPKLADAASSDRLKAVVEDHLAETLGHVARLERIIGNLELPYPTDECEAMRGLVHEADRAMAADGDPMARDIALIAAAQRVEHYEMAAYGTASTLAAELGLSEVRNLLEQTLEEERNADRTLSKLATGDVLRRGLNEQAAR